MTTQAVSAIENLANTAIRTVESYNTANKTLVGAYRTGVQRLLALVWEQFLVQPSALSRRQVGGGPCVARLRASAWPARWSTPSDQPGGVWYSCSISRFLTFLFYRIRVFYNSFFHAIP